jgi:hypothetical protein
MMPTEKNFALLVGLLSGGLTLAGAQEVMEKSDALDAPAQPAAH